MARILWVEDEGNTDLIQYKQPLVEAGHVVDVVETAEEAFGTLDSMEYHLYIVDLLLPQEDAFQEYIDFPGVEILRKMVNKYGIDPETVMVFTVVNDEKIHKDIQELGIQRITVKRLQTIDFLKEEVEKMLQRGRR